MHTDLLHVIGEFVSCSDLASLGECSAQCATIVFRSAVWPIKRVGLRPVWRVCEVQSLPVPASVRQMTLHDDFDQPLEELPAGLTHLTCGYTFAHPVPALPLSLTHLIFDDCFDCPVDHLPLNANDIARRVLPLPRELVNIVSNFAEL